MSVLDEINEQCGRGTLRPARVQDAGLGAEAGSTKPYLHNKVERIMGGWSKVIFSTVQNSGVLCLTAFSSAEINSSRSLQSGTEGFDGSRLFKFRLSPALVRSVIISEQVLHRAPS